jgi:hypothetical protein
MRRFRQTRDAKGFSSSDLQRSAHDLLDFLAERVPQDALERFFGTTRTYMIQHEDELFA